jgi:pilus assembly protein CpaB
MKSRLVMVVIALILGLMAAFGVFLYANGVKQQVEQDQKTAKVLVAEEDIPIGLGLSEIMDKRLASFQKVPKKYVASGVIASSKDIDGQVLAFSVQKGEQITTDRFQYNTKAGLAFAIPKDHVALSISVDEVKGVSGMVKAGDLVNIIATLSGSSGATIGEDMTKILLSNVKVIAVGNVIAPQEGRAEEQKTLTSSGSSSSDTGKRVVTLALTPGDAEKVVFAEEKGSVWLSLLPASESESVSTPGQTHETVFK